MRDLAAQFTPRPLSSTEPRSPARNARELLPRLLEGAQFGVDALVESIRLGHIKGRDLAVATGVLFDKAAKLEREETTEEPPSLAELEAAEAEAERLLAERRGRG